MHPPKFIRNTPEIHDVDIMYTFSPSMYTFQGQMYTLTKF